MKALFHAPAFCLGLSLLCFTSTGCRGIRGGLGLAKTCEGGACEGPQAHVMTDQTPAELFASMNAKEFEREIQMEARTAEKVASLPKGPDSLFKPYR
ncbi:MAG: hypothetical protein AAFX06_07125 [Planctomycetota bacterium]